MIRPILFTLMLLFSFNLQAFEWQGYNSDLQLARELSNAQIIAKASGVEEARKSLKQLLQALSSNMVTTGSESSDHFLLGLSQLGVLSLNRLTIWSHVGTKGRDIWLNSEEFKTQNAIITDHYVKGLNYAIESGEKIDPQWLYIITASTILDTQVRESIIRYEMHLNQSSPPTETYFWDSYSSIYEAYLNKKDYGNAQRILDEMSNKFPQKKQKVQKAQLGLEKYIEEHSEKIKKEAAEYEAPVNKSAEAALEKVIVISEEDKFEPEGEQVESIELVGLDRHKNILFALAFFLLFGLYFIARHKRK